ncbi:penicillin-binding protein 2B [Bacillus oleivorans]|uniref:serine-type D-Ala-D-Ala carboxypeptidase n=1 Tax=Bacillus oleivorans TaxID=1448271 RepID=A0A285D287_9BACI|nr:penicillin-binding transpeptidase domain-containing protein [Bacillus oleivorans]SNX73428.1 penicillin-binding protein 2B [Bacillus oleivorans]
MIKKQPSMTKGAVLLFFGFGLLFLLLVSRFVYLQSVGEVQGKSLAEEAINLYTNENSIEASRGSILDRNGQVIAEDTNTFKLVAVISPKASEDDPENPRHVEDKQMTAETLSEFIPMSAEEIFNRLNPENKDLWQVEFGTAGSSISYSVKEEIEALELPGIYLYREQQRFYPNGVFASHLVGFTQLEKQEDGTEKMVGQLGIEQSYQEFLEGKNGKMQYQSDAWGVLLPDGKEQIIPSQNGDTIYLTIDTKIQTFLEDAMTTVQEQYNPKQMIAIIADPDTGAILAMSQRPTFHPQTREGINETWHNLAIESAYEPGSTMKIFTLAAAVEENAFNPNAKFQSGQLKIGPNTVNDHNWGRGWGEITFLQGVQNSSNVGFGILARDYLGYEKFLEYLNKFGFGKPTGIGLPGEVTGKILYNYEIEKITTAFGQGTTLTPIQQIQAATAIANEGKMMKPYVVGRIKDGNTGAVIEETEPEVVGQPISKETAKEVLDILETVITAEDGTGKRYAIEGYSVAGKTGTAQIPDPENGGYLDGYDDFVYSFLGMAPKDDPELIMYVAIQQPDLDEEVYESGSVPVSMIFNPVMKNSLQYLKIEPNNLPKPEPISVPNLVDDNSQNSFTKLEELGLTPIVIGDGTKIMDQVPLAGTTLLPGERVLLLTNGTRTVPDMTGWSLQDVMKFVKITNIQLNNSGSGYVIRQSLPAGSELTDSDILVVELEPPSKAYEKDEEVTDEAGADEEQIEDSEDIEELEGT